MSDDDQRAAVAAAKESLMQGRADCAHALARERSFKCPSCGGILRRCCQSVLGQGHGDDCGR
jgi:predicted RNA-binding Zn-ribbon protein involved in translation (DUF1610 family)